jgi:hypothetical protein
MIYGRFRRRLQVPVRVLVPATLVIPRSARRNSTASLCSYRASEKAENSFSVRVTCSIFPLVSFTRTTPLVAPKPVTRHLVVTARPAEPTRPAPGGAASDPATFENPPREAYPDEVLTHRFRPYGDPGDPPPAPPEDQMDDHEHAEEGAKEKEKEKRKKRRGEAGESPKKVKKAKTAAS